MALWPGLWHAGLRACLALPERDTILHAPLHEHNLSEQPFRRGVGVCATLAFVLATTWQTADSLAARDPPGGLTTTTPMPLVPAEWFGIA